MKFTLQFKDKPRINIFAEVDDLSLKGNVQVSGDAASDKRAEDEIRARIAADDIWAWCCVTVTASWHGFEGKAVLGACNYESEEAFKTANDYYPEMVKEATENLQKKVEAATAAILNDLLWKEE